MTSIVANAVLVAHRSRLVVSGERVLYRADGVGVPVDVVPARIDQEESSDEAGGVSFRVADWIVAAEDLVLDGTKIKPATGHEIDWTDDNGVKRTFLVCNRDEPRCFQPCDRGGLLLRIFTSEKPANAETQEP